MSSENLAKCPQCGDMIDLNNAHSCMRNQNAVYVPPMSSDTPTPRTDDIMMRVADETPLHHRAYIKIAVSDMERELAEARKELAEYRAATDPHYVDELAEARAEIERCDAFMVTAAETLRKTEAENERLRELLIQSRSAVKFRLDAAAIDGVVAEVYQRLLDNIDKALASRGRENPILSRPTLAGGSAQGSVSARG